MSIPDLDFELTTIREHRSKEEPAAKAANPLIEEQISVQDSQISGISGGGAFENRDLATPGNQGELPDSVSKWDATPRYLLAELARTGLLDRATAERVVRIAWHNSTACGQRRRELQA